MVLNSGRAFDEISSTFTIQQMSHLLTYKTWKRRQTSKTDVRIAYLLDAIYKCMGGVKNGKLVDYIISWKNKKKKKKEQDPERSKAIWMNWLGVK
jgi:hypothetical protein